MMRTSSAPDRSSELSPECGASVPTAVSASLLKVSCAPFAFWCTLSVTVKAAVSYGVRRYTNTRHVATRHATVNHGHIREARPRTTFFPNVILPSHSEREGERGHDRPFFLLKLQSTSKNLQLCSSRLALARPLGPQQACLIA